MKTLTLRLHWACNDIENRTPARAHLDSGYMLDFVLEACGPIPLVDFNRAKAKFAQVKSVDDLLKMQ